MIQSPKTGSSYQVDFLQSLANTGIRQFAAGGKARAFGDIFATELGNLETRDFLNLGETLLPYATGTNLDFIGEIYGVPRLGQQVASVEAIGNNFSFYVKSGTFGSLNNGRNILIPAGVQITTSDPNGPVFVTDPITLAAGQSQAYFSATCTTPGVTGNQPQNVFTSHNFTAYADAAYGSLLVTNQYGVVGGRDDESDDSYRYRIHLKILAQSQSNESALRLLILKIPGIQDVVFESSASTFNCYVYGISPQIGPSLINAVQQVINQSSAFPSSGLALAPDLVGISLATTVTTPSTLSSSDQAIVISNAVNAAQAYINNLGIGQTLVINEIASQILNADSRITDIGQPNNQIPEILIWRSRADGSRYSRYLLGNYTPQVGERVVVEIHAGLLSPITISVV